MIKVNIVSLGPNTCMIFGSKTENKKMDSSMRLSYILTYLVSSALGYSLLERLIGIMKQMMLCKSDKPITITNCVRSACLGAEV